MVQRTQDVSTLKQNTDNRPVVEQQVLAGEVKKQNTQQLRQVTEQEDAQEGQKKYDAREKGSNKYENLFGKKKKKQEKPQESVVEKSRPSGFDMKI
jgi:hypothetical protein